MNKVKILFLDKDKTLLIAFKTLFKNKYQVLLSDNPNESLVFLQEQDIAVVIVSQFLDDVFGIEILKQALSISPKTIRILMVEATLYNNDIIEYISKIELFRVLYKPWDNDAFRFVVDIAVNIYLQSIQIVKNCFVNIQDKIAILILDDDITVVQQLKELNYKKAVIHYANNMAKAKEIIVNNEIAVIVFDIIVDNSYLLDFIAEIKNIYPYIVTVVLTQQTDSDQAIDFVNYGQVYRYLRKPIHDILLCNTIKQAYEVYQHNKENHTILLQQNYVSIR